MQKKSNLVRFDLDSLYDCLIIKHQTHIIEKLSREIPMYQYMR
jgi:hypothetical protein